MAIEQEPRVTRENLYTEQLETLQRYTDAQVHLTESYSEVADATRETRDMFRRLVGKEILLSGLVIMRYIQTPRGSVRLSVGSAGYFTAPPTTYKIAREEAPMAPGTLLVSTLMQASEEQYVMPYEKLIIYRDIAEMRAARAEFDREQIQKNKTR